MSVLDVADAFETIVGRAPSPDEQRSIADYARDAGLTRPQLLHVLLARGDVVSEDLAGALDLHLFAIHAARVRLMGSVLPPARRILDLGGANAPLCDCGYPHPFEQLVVVDLPPEERHAEFAGRIVEGRQTPLGPMSVLYTDMTRLDVIPTASIQLVWSGQSIEHITRDDAQRVYAEVRRVLSPDGWFCLDTPNRLLTAIHAGDVFIHPDHKFEYTPAELTGDLEAAGFHVEESLGVCDMPLTVRAGRIDYRDFIVGAGITTAVDSAYIQYHRCRVR